MVACTIVSPSPIKPLPIWLVGIYSYISRALDIWQFQRALSMNKKFKNGKINVKHTKLWCLYKVVKQTICPTQCKIGKESGNSKSGIECVFLMIYHLGCTGLHPFSTTRQSSSRLPWKNLSSTTFLPFPLL